MLQISEGGVDSKGMSYFFQTLGPKCDKKCFSMYAKLASPVQWYQRQYGSWTKVTKTHLDNQVEARQVKAI